ncbi:MAG: hypothetical protein K6A44_05110 [bacterium]|nr:hypothetical protein [bacterium]
MKLGGICSISNLSYSGRLLKEDIVRLPSPQTNKADFYVSAEKNHPKKRSVFWRNFFTALTFGLTGLYIAHRNNLFNPARKQAKKIVKSDEMIGKVKEFIEAAINPETYQKASRKTLELLSGDKSRGQGFMSEARTILDNESSMQKLFGEVSKKLADDKDATSLKNGFAVDVLDKLSVRIEKILKTMKQNGNDIRNQGANMISRVFSKDEKGATIVEDALLEVIGTRSSATIEGFVQDSLIASKLGKGA